MLIQAIRVDADFMHIGFADQQSTGVSQPRDHRRIMLGRFFPQKSRSARCRIRHLVHLIFYGYRHSVQSR